jgi:quinol monooxygenase YgiN
MIIVVAKIRFANQDDRDRAVELSTPVQQATRDQEAGCHDYCFAPDPCDGNIILVY